MDDLAIRAAGQLFQIGEDLYGVSVGALEERIAILHAECSRIAVELEKKADGLSKADDIFKKL